MFRQNLGSAPDPPGVPLRARALVADRLAQNVAKVAADKRQSPDAALAGNTVYWGDGIRDRPSRHIRLPTGTQRRPATTTVFGMRRGNGSFELPFGSVRQIAERRLAGLRRQANDVRSTSAVSSSARFAQLLKPLRSDQPKNSASFSGSLGRIDDVGMIGSRAGRSPNLVTVRPKVFDCRPFTSYMLLTAAPSLRGVRPHLNGFGDRPSDGPNRPPPEGSRLC